MSKKRSLKFETGIEPRGAAAYLELLAHGLREGRILLTTGGEKAGEIGLDVAGAATLQIKASSNAKKGRTSISIDLDWRDGDELSQSLNELFITSGAAADEQQAAEEATEQSGPVEEQPL